MPFMMIPVLRDLFPAEKWPPAWRLGSQLTPTAISWRIVTALRRRCAGPVTPATTALFGQEAPPHPQNPAGHRSRGEILTLSAGHRGPQADLKIYEEVPLPEPLATTPRLGDKGYASQHHPELTTPDKKPRGGELTETQRAENKELARQRIVVEHAIRRVKGFRIMREDYRLAPGLFPMIASAVVGLIQCSRILS